MLEVQKIFLIVRCFNRTFCNKGLKTKNSCFFSCFFSLTSWGWNNLESERPLCSWCHIDWRNTKTCIHGASWMERKQVNVENRQFLKERWEFLSVIWIKWKQSVCSITLPILALFTACFYLFLFWRNLNSSMTSFSSDILFPFPNSNGLNKRDIEKLLSHVVFDRLRRLAESIKKGKFVTKSFFK